MTREINETTKIELLELCEDDGCKCGNTCPVMIVTVKTGSRDGIEIATHLPPVKLLDLRDKLSDMLKLKAIEAELRRRGIDPDEVADGA